MSRGSTTRRSATAQPSAAAARPARPDLAREEHDAGHRRGPQRPTADAPAKSDVGDDRDGGDHGSSPTPEPAGEGGDRRRDDRDVPARDRDDVADAGRREGCREVAVDPVAQADEDPCRQAGLRLRKDARQRASPAPRRIDSSAVAGSTGRSRSTSAPRVEGSPRSGPGEVVAVRTVGSTPDTAVDLHAITRFDRRVARQRRRPAGTRSRRLRPCGASPPACRPAAIRSTRRSSSTARRSVSRPAPV